MHDVKFWIAQAVGCFAMVALVLSYQQKKREKLILCKLSADVFWVVNFFLVGGHGGMISNSIGIVRESIFFHRGKRKWASSPVWPAVFILAGWSAFFIALFAFGDGTFSIIHILPICATTCATLSFWSRDPLLTKALSAPATGSFLVYNLLISNYVGAINESVVLVSITVGIIRGIHARRQCRARSEKEN